jgi:hypothetical protein
MRVRREGITRGPLGSSLSPVIANGSCWPRVKRDGTDPHSHRPPAAPARALDGLRGVGRYRIAEITFRACPGSGEGVELAPITDPSSARSPRSREQQIARKRLLSVPSRTRVFWSFRRPVPTGNGMVNRSSTAETRRGYGNESTLFRRKPIPAAPSALRGPPDKLFALR